MVRCAISLGGNLGDVPETFAAAARLLADSAGVSDMRLSRTYRTRAMGAHAGGEFHNAAAVFDSTLVPLDLLTVLQEIENRCGRVTTVRWGPRTLDLDLLLYRDQIIVSSSLIVPHPAMWYRRFVLDPLVELIPNAVHPVFGESIRELRDRLLIRPLPVYSADAKLDSLHWAEAMLSIEQVDVVRLCSEVDWLSEESAPQKASIIFAATRSALVSPHLIRLPDDPAASAQLIADVLTAALDEPKVTN